MPAFLIVAFWFHISAFIQTNAALLSLKKPNGLKKLTAITEKNNAIATMIYFFCANIFAGKVKVFY